MKVAQRANSGGLPALRARQKPALRGARPKQSQRKALSVNWSIVRRSVAVLALVAIVVGLISVAGRVLNVPVSRVVVNGEFQQVDKESISKQITPFLQAGFLKLDLNGIRQQLRQQPWIFDVKISRRWPNEVTILVEEQTPIARWGSNGFLNYRGELFVPETVNTKFMNAASFPALDGPQGASKNVMNHYRELSDMLSQHGLALVELRLNERGAWYARLENGTSMRLGEGEVMEKMRRFLSAYRYVLASKFDQVSAVDMRYSGGFAVSWKDKPVP